MWYNDLRPASELTPNKYALIFIDDDLQMSEADKKRTLGNLIALKQGLTDQVPKKEMDRNILLASWNIKEFGHLNERLPESYFYIAEIINAFDIVAIQEIKSSLDDLKIIMRLLGKHYSYVITDITEGRAGNKERFGFIYDTRRVQHSGLSGELVISPEVAGDAVHLPQLKRTPTITGFESAWKKFSIVGVHLHPGNDDDDQQMRKEEVQMMLDLLADKRRKGHLWNKNLVILGDTNFYRNNDDIVQLFTDEGYSECENLLGKDTNTSQTQPYDRIFMNVDQYFKLQKNSQNRENGNVFHLYDYVLTNAQRALYHDFMLAHKNNPATLTSDSKFESYFQKYWKRNQISDHLPVWIEIEADSSPDFLESKKNQINV